MKSLPWLAMFLFVGCSHVQEPVKTVHFPYAGELLGAIQKSEGRAPASIKLVAKEQKSPRRVYFSALYYQYLTLGNQESVINSCPQFHHDKLETDAQQTPKFSMYKVSSIDKEGQDFFPELAFDKKFSLKDYHQSIREELDILCEEGVSDNFYKFDNLVTHYANKPSFHMSKTAMESVLKIPVFANFYLIKMIKVSPEPMFPEEKRLIEMTHTSWFEKYVVEASKLRNNFIKPKMVKR